MLAKSVFAGFVCALAALLIGYMAFGGFGPWMITITVAVWALAGIGAHRWLSNRSSDGPRESAQQREDRAIERAEHWEARYAEKGSIWSGNVNAQIASLVPEIEANSGPSLDPAVTHRALDLGCGEGADAIWLASRGWDVTGVDLSATALARAEAAARERGLSIEWIQADLESWKPRGAYELITASFLHSPVEFPRAEVLARAAAALRPGGHLVIVSHAAPPPWAADHGSHAHRFVPVAEELAGLDFPESKFEVIRCEERERVAVGPDGKEGNLRDGVIVVRRR